MPIDFVLLLIAVAVASMGLTAIIRHRALRAGVLDVPNERSSHTVPTPRGGGVAIVATATAGLLVLLLTKRVSFDVAMALLGGGLAVAFIGYLDDRYQLSARVRFTVHVAAAVWALYWLGGLPPLQFGARVITFGWEGYLLGILGIVWSLNLFNFMDGIDGIAASQAVFMACLGAMVATSAELFGGVPAAAWVLAAGSLGFLAWNWPPAKIFMGDAGSGYLGYSLAVLALGCARENASALLIWLILGAVFFVDATVTLARRLLRGERVHQAHRSHAYQRLSRKWGSHRRVTLAVLLVNFAWLLPCAWFASIHPEHAGRITLISLLPIVIAVIAVGAGRRDSAT